MTDFHLPVIRHLTADQVEPGMTIAGRRKDTRVYGVASSRYINTKDWCTADGQSLGSPIHGYDLLAEAPKPDVELPQEVGAVIRYESCGDLEIAHRLDGYWLLDGRVSRRSEKEILEYGAKNGYEVAHWHKPGEGPGIPKKLHEKLRGMDFNSPIFRAVAGPGYLLSGNIHSQEDVLDVLRWAASQPVQDSEA